MKSGYFQEGEDDSEGKVVLDLLYKPLYKMQV